MLVAKRIRKHPVNLKAVPTMRDSRCCICRSRRGAVLPSREETLFTQKGPIVILRLPQPLSEHSERKAAEDGEGSRTTLSLPQALPDCAAWQIVDLPHTKPQFRSCPMRCRWRSFAVLRRSSLATLLSGCGRLRMTNRSVVFFTTCQDDREVELSPSMLHP